MNGIHDLGGMHGHGPVTREQDEPLFHSEWEKRMFGMFITTFAAGCFNIDEFRHAIEKMDPAHYLESSYYEHWMHAVEALIVENGFVTQDELDARREQFAAEA